MLVSVHLDNCIEALLQCFAICGKPYDGENECRIILRGSCAADLEDFGLVSCINIVAGCRTGITSYDGKVGT